ncbi:MAG TPA: FAD-linked oxidase C-terminal domain-containing protein [Longimicrobiales bacterium]
MARVALPPPLPAELAAGMREILGDEGVLVDPSEMLVYESDGLVAYRVPPRAVLLPRDTGETSRAVRALAARRIPFVARGAGTGLSGGALALEESVVISTARMRAVLEIDAPNLRARVQPGVINAELSRIVAAHGLYFAPDPSSQSACTLGGNVAENAGGPHCLKYGVTTDHVLGLTVVLPDGTVVELGGTGETIGYDLTGLWVGSEGTFGIATELTLTLSRLPEARATMLAIFDRLDDASHAVSAVVGAGLLPAALEMIDQATIRAVEASVFAAGFPTDAAAALVIEFDGARAGIDAEAADAARICSERGAREVRLAADDVERETLWRGRKKAFGAMGRLAPELLVQDAVVPRTALPRVLARVIEIGAEHGLRVANVFHAGDGNLHPCILYDRRDPDELRRVEHASREMMRVCIEAGGTVTGEHGIGLDKRDYMDGVFDQATLQAMCAVKRVFDPAGLANPAKVLPVRVCREWVGPATRVESSA